MKLIELEAGEHILEIDIKAFIINPGRMFFTPVRDLPSVM